ncbi:DEAD/DEAH box helicase [Nemorincola caseinilytica]|uniref:DEAD/DEAH box helicase n=2 Tax=Nemorincola caseinilytica TaxID=2054315 RepID=A0ABP8N8D6_9BACT
MANMEFRELNLSTPLLNALDDLGYKHPTTIQHKIFSVIMSGRDVCGIAQTGTGKTLAYLLPCLRMWQYAKDRYPQILIIVPTRELVLQVTEEIKKLTTYMNVVAIGVYGGVNMRTHVLEAENGCDVVVATPGRLMDLVLHGSLRLKNIKRLVIDEVDEMFNLGFRTQINNILDVLPPRRQNLLFSATITPEVEALMQTYFNDPERVEAAPAGTPLSNIDQQLYHVPNFHTKVNLLEMLLSNDEAMTKVLVFAATKKLADELYEHIEGRFPGKVGVIHSNKAQNHRFNTVSNFRNGIYTFIIATDLVARGIDIAEVTHVINFDVPEEAESYIHRIGRTGRADRKGISITFATEREMEALAAIEKLMSYQIPVSPLPEDLEISDVLTDDELPKVHMRETLIVLPKVTDSGGAFHEKLARNKKVNVKISHKEKMRAKYGKPKTRGAKKK